METKTQTPSEYVVAAGNQTVVVTDVRGRKITVKKMNALGRMRLFEVVGPDNVQNEAYFGFASLACHVTAIDGDPVIQPTTKNQLEALVQRLDDDGLNAVGKAIEDNFLPKKTDPKDEIKNG
jgi:hypothetical protein